MNFGFKLPEIVRFAERGGRDYDSARLARAKKMQIVLSAEAREAAEEYAIEMRKFGVYDLPFDECYFEIVFSDARLGYLCWKEDGGIFAKTYQWWSDRIELPDYTISVACLPHGNAAIVRQERRANNNIVPSTFRLLEIAIERRDLERELHNVHEQMIPCDQANIDVAIGSLSLGGAQSSPGARRRSSPLAKSISGEFFSHSVISVPLDRGGIGVRSKPGAPRSPVRLHWRRGHIRRLPNGSLTKVRPSLIGDRRFGAISSEYVIQSHSA